MTGTFPSAGAAAGGPGPAWLRRWPLAVAVLLAAGVLGPVLALAPRYMTNDDALMNLIAAGRVIGDAPDEHLIYTNVLIGRSLKALYAAAPDVPWYGAYLSAMQVASLTALCYVFLRARPAWPQLLMAAVYLAAYGVPTLLAPQFTMVAFTAAAAGLLLLCAAASGRAGRVAWVVGPALVVLGAMVRTQAWGLAGLILSPVVALALLRPSGPRARWGLLLGLAGSLAVVGGLVFLNARYYASGEGWEDFYGYLTLISELQNHGLSLGQGVQPALDAIGWTQTDLEMIVSWSYADPERFSAANVSTVLAAARGAAAPPAASDWGSLWALLSGDQRVHLLLATGLACWLMMPGDRRTRAAALLCLLVTVALVPVLYFYFRLPARVYLPMFAAFPAAGLALASAPPVRPRRRLVPFLLTCAALVLTAVLLAQRTDHEVRQRVGRRYLHAQALEMMARLSPRPDQLFVLWSDEFPYEELVSPQDAGLPRGFKAVGFGWTTPTPWTRRRLDEFGISDLYRALYEREDLLLVCKPERLPLLSAYLEQHYGVRTEGREVFSHPALHGANVYQVRKTTAAP
jgi:hypothetical protein